MSAKKPSTPRWVNVTNPNFPGAVHVLRLSGDKSHEGLEIELRMEPVAREHSVYYPHSGWYVACATVGVSCWHLRGVAVTNENEAKRRAVLLVQRRLRKIATDLQGVQ